MRKLITTLVCFCLSVNTFAAVAIDSQKLPGSDQRGTTSGSPITWTFNNVAGTKLICIGVVTCTTGGTAAFSSAPTYGGVSMTQGCTKAWDTVASLVRIYYLDAPLTSSNTVSMTGTGASTFGILGGCFSLTGAASGIGTNTSGSTASGTTAVAGTITTDSGNFIVAGGGWGSGAGGSAGVGFTTSFFKNGSGNTAGDDILGEYKLSTGTVTTPSFSWTSTDNGGICAAEVLAGSSFPAALINNPLQY